MTTEPLEKLITEQLRQSLAAKNSDYDPESLQLGIDHGGTSWVYTLARKQGRPEKPTLVVKLDKLEGQGPVSRYHMELGLTKKRQYEFCQRYGLGLDDNIIPPVDHGIVHHNGTELAYTIEPYLAKAQRFDRWLEDRIKKAESCGIGVLEESEFVQIMRGIQKAIRKLHEQELALCDLGTANIAITLDDEKVDGAYIWDVGNIIELAKQTPSERPISGSRKTVPPWLFSAFTGEKTIYTKKADVYQIGVLYHLLTRGQIPITHDPVAEQPFADQTPVPHQLARKSLLTREGTLDEKFYRKAIRQKKSVPSRPGWARKYDNIYWRSMDLPGSGIEDAIQLSEAFGKVKDPGAYQALDDQKVKYWAGFGFALFVSAFALAPALLSEYSPVSVEERREVQAVIGEDARIPAELGVNNDIFDANIYSISAGRDWIVHPEAGDYLETNPGDTVRIVVDSRRRASFLEDQRHIEHPYRAKAFIEGTNSIIPFEITTRHNEYQGYHMTSDVALAIPKSLPSGMYRLRVETYAPKNPHAHEAVTYLVPNQVLTSDYIDLAHGDVQANRKLSAEQMQLRTYQGYPLFYEILLAQDESLRADTSLRAVIYSPSLRISESRNPASELIYSSRKKSTMGHAFWIFDMPYAARIETEDPHIIFAATHDPTGNVVSTQFHTVGKREETTNNSYGDTYQVWVLAPHDITYADTLATIRKKYVDENNVLRK